MDTIFAPASGSRRAGVAVIRVSGPAARATLQELAGPKDFPPRQAVFTELSDAAGQPLDQALAIYFKAPASFTGQDVVEYHVHGGRAVIEGVLSALGKIPGCRLADPGEFTKRAFENGKIDLTGAEAIADLIDAETEAQKTQALEQLGGTLARLYQGWADRLTKILAHQEADIEFPDEDLPQGVSEGLRSEVSALLSDVARHLDDNRRGERLRSGLLIAIVGAPNAGKSSLLNALAGREAAIVSDEAGTTRDVIEVHLDLGGYPVTVADTAGLRQTEGKIEAEGIRRAMDTARRADLKIALFDGTAPEDAETLKLIDEKTIVVFSKSDLSPETTKAGYWISSVTGSGIDAVLKVLAARTEEAFGRSSGPALTRARHRSALKESRAALERSLAAHLPELAAEDLRLALRAIGRITGRVHVEELLDKIFRDFCIGK